MTRAPGKARFRLPSSQVVWAGVRVVSHSLSERKCLRDCSERHTDPVVDIQYIRSCRHAVEPISRYPPGNVGMSTSPTRRDDCDTVSGWRAGEHTKGTDTHHRRFGWHPDDCVSWRRGVRPRGGPSRADKVKFVSVTNGDIGHHQMADAILARRRTDEAFSTRNARRFWQSKPRYSTSTTASCCRPWKTAEPSLARFASGRPMW